MFNIKSFTKQCIRVWRILKRPSNQEFTTVAKVSAIGLVLVGTIGFIISLTMSYLNIG